MIKIVLALLALVAVATFASASDKFVCPSNSINVLQTKFNELEKKFQQVQASAASKGHNNFASFNRYGEEGFVHAQATCASLNDATGWTFAVRRECNGNAPTCAQVCAGLKENQAGDLECFNSLHLYTNPMQKNVAQHALKTYRYNSCGGGCGPNYCCCRNKSASKLAFNRFGLEAQAQAQAACIALNPKAGWTFAVQRECSANAPTCAQVCAGLKENQAGQLKCFNSLHIYTNQPFGNHGSLGLKTYRYNSCGGGCGPNYCCCSN